MADQSNYDDEDLALSLRRNWENELEEEAAAEERARGAGEPFGAPAAPAHELWFPRADRTVAMHMRGNYAKGYPVGAVVHFTAGRRERGDIDAEQTMKNGRDNRYLYFCISSTGKVYQPAALNKWGSHCGESSHADLGHSLSNQLTGIEVCAAGRLKKTSLGYEPWWNDEYPAGSPKRTYYQEHEVRFTDRLSRRKRVTTSDTRRSRKRAWSIFFFGCIAPSPMSSRSNTSSATMRFRPAARTIPAAR